MAHRLTVVPRGHRLPSRSDANKKGGVDLSDSTPPREGGLLHLIIRYVEAAEFGIMIAGCSFSGQPKTDPAARFPCALLRSIDRDWTEPNHEARLVILRIFLQKGEIAMKISALSLKTHWLRPCQHRNRPSALYRPRTDGEKLRGGDRRGRPGGDRTRRTAVGRGCGPVQGGRA